MSSSLLPGSTGCIQGGAPGMGLGSQIKKWSQSRPGGRRGDCADGRQESRDFQVWKWMHVRERLSAFCKGPLKSWQCIRLPCLLLESYHYNLSNSLTDCEEPHSPVETDLYPSQLKHSHGYFLNRCHPVALTWHAKNSLKYQQIQLYSTIPKY
jgi:hypothetical protein